MKSIITTMFLLAALNLSADETSAKATKVFEKYKSSIVSISLVLSTEISLGGNTLPSKEKNVETKATVFSKDLLVTAYSNIDASILQGLTEFRGQKVEMKSTYKEVKLITDDGSEIPLKVVLVDKDRNLAFLTFDKKHTDYQKTELRTAGFDNAFSAKPLDPVINITRLGKSLYRSPKVRIGRITALVEKPSKIYLSTDVESGTPVYTLEGGLIGVATVKTGKKNVMIVITVEEIKEIASQAKANL